MAEFELLLQQIDDLYIRENFRRLKKDLDALAAGGGANITNITNPTTIVNGAWEKFDTTINASSTEVVAQEDLGSFTSVKYILSFNSDPNSITQYYEINVVRKGSTLEDSMPVRNGMDADIDVNINSVGLNLELSITNNEAFNLNLYAAKLVL